jgi:hypothetical protein
VRRIVFRLGLFESESERAYSERVLTLLVHGLVLANVAYLRAHSRAPSLDDAGVRLAPPTRCLRDADEWKGIEAILSSGVANNVSLAAWRCAEEIARGSKAAPIVRWVTDDEGARRDYHVLVRNADGSIEDPSADLFEREHGMDIRSRLTGRSDLHAPASRVAFAVRLFRGEHERRYSEAVLSILLGTLTSADALYLRTRRDAVPALYQAGVRYQAERFPREEWKGIAALHEDGEGDCEDLACARSAELIAKGLPARPVFRWRRLDRLSVYHILVRHPDGAIEDPSLLLGMGERGATLADLGLGTARASAARDDDGARTCAQGDGSWERC